ncbi:MAG: helix-turn-helix domain-containing protein [Planctomycetes bacterium]|nr:helix-turn-helix domain-containing protein [Planctomycetota bacterium]
MPYPHVYIKLTPEERGKITRELKRLLLAGQHKKRKPLQALWLSDQQKTFEDISRSLGVTYRTMQRWIARYRKSGIGGFIR